MTRQGIDQGCCYPWWEKVFYSSFNDLQKLRLQNLDSAVTCTVLCSQWRSLPLPLPLCQAPSHWLCTNARFHSSLGSLHRGFIHRRWLSSCIVPSSFMVHISELGAGRRLIWLFFDLNGLGTRVAHIAGPPFTGVIYFNSAESAVFYFSSCILCLELTDFLVHPLAPCLIWLWEFQAWLPMSKLLLQIWRMKEYFNSFPSTTETETCNAFQCS